MTNYSVFFRWLHINYTGMRDYEFLLVVEEICSTLNLSRPTVAYCLELLTLFRDSDTHNFKIDVGQT